MLSEKEKKQLESARQQGKAFAKTEEGKKFEKPLPETKKKKESRLRRLKRLLKMIALGKKYKQPKKPLRETVRTRAITKRGLKVAGLTEKEIARLKGKK